MNQHTIAKIAMVAHSVNRAYCQAIGDYSQHEWDEAPEWQRESAINGVKFHIENPNASPSASHENWLREKREQGWKYGPVKDPNAKTHPCCVPYEDLPIEQRVKDYLFIGVVRSMMELYS